MSCYEEEQGEIRLPTKEVSKVKLALRDEQEQLRAAAMKLATDFWEYAKKTRSAKLYEQRLEEWVRRERQMAETNTRASAWRRARKPTAAEHIWLCDELYEAFTDLLEDLAQSPRKLQLKDLDSDPRKAFVSWSSRTTAFRCGMWAHASFDGAVLRWRVTNNNKSVLSAYEHPLTQRLWATLSAIKWTRGSGGTVWYRNEYTPMQDGAQPKHQFPPSKDGSTRAHGRAYW